MVKKSYGCSILVVGVLAGISWLAYEEVNARLDKFKADSLSLQGAGEADARSILGDPDYQISYRDPDRDTKLQELVIMYPGLEQRQIEEKALVYVKFRRCTILYVNKIRRVTDVSYGEQQQR